MALAQTLSQTPSGENGDERRWLAGPIDLGGISSGLALLARHWFERQIRGAVPDRSAIDPSALKPILPNMSVLGLERIGGTVHTVCVRLWGTGLVQVYGRDVTGQRSHQFHSPEQNDDLLARIREITDRRMPLFWRQRSLVKGCADLVAERVFCPLTAGGDQIESVMGVLEFSGEDIDPRMLEGFGPLLLGHS